MRKRIRLTQKKDDCHDLGSDDLLSRFSDDILVSILSYLPIKEAAVTSKLSRRWRYLWCQTVRLEFEDKENSIKIEKARQGKYINWVNSVIRQHKSPNIDEFKICFDLDKNAKDAIGRWIEFAISKNVHRLELDLRGGGYSKENYAFPDKIFARKRELSMKGTSSNIPVRPNATFMEIKFLKALILKCVDVNEEGLKKILSNCPVLEHLLIDRSRNLVKAKIHGKGLALKSLEIMFCDGLESIEICDSNIVSFKCCNPEDPPISLRLDNLQKLEKIYICDYEMKINHMFYQLSCGIPYLKVLELIVYCPQEDMQFFPFPKLPKLKQLIMRVGTWDDRSLSVLTSMVEACSNLQRLTIQLTWMLFTFGLINCQAAKPPHQHLEVVEIIGWTCDLDMVMYFIENSVALKKLVITPYITKEELAGLTANEITKKKNAARYRVQQQLEPKIPIGVELVVL